MEQYLETKFTHSRFRQLVVKTGGRRPHTSPLLKHENKFKMADGCSPRSISRQPSEVSDSQDSHDTMFSTDRPCAPEDDVLEDGSASLADSEEESEHEECGNDAPLYGVDEGVDINRLPLFKHYNRAYYNVHPDAVERNYADPQKVATKEDLFALTRDFAAKGKFQKNPLREQQHLQPHI